MRKLKAGLQAKHFHVALIALALCAIGCNSGGRGTNTSGTNPAAGGSTNPGSTPGTTPGPNPGPTPGTTPTGSGGTGGMVGLQSRTLTVAGNSVDYLVYAPIQYDPAQAWPVLFVFHGQGGTNLITLSNWMSLADMNGFVVAATQGTGSSGGWSPAADSQVLQNALNDVEGAFNIDTKRRYMWGYSAGGHFAHIIGLANSTFFAAYAVSAGVVQQSYNATRLIPVSIHIGTTDPLLPGAQRDRTELMNRGHTVEYHEFQGGHTILPGHRQQAWDDMKGHSLP